MKKTVKKQPDVSLWWAARKRESGQNLLSTKKTGKTRFFSEKHAFPKPATHQAAKVG
jgi:hypothetical protein